MVTLREIDKNLIPDHPYRKGADAEGERCLKKGDTSKPVYYIIRPVNNAANGLLCAYCICAGYIRYALLKGYFPVVDMQNYQNGYLAPEKFGKENAWEYYFEQPFRIGLEEAYAGENVILSSLNFSAGRCLLFLEHDYFKNKDNSNLIAFRTLVQLGLLKVKPNIMKKILSIREKLFAPTDRVLGVKMRGTDYIAHRPKHHPIPPP